MKITPELIALAKRLESALGGVQVTPDDRRRALAAIMQIVADPKSSNADKIRAAGAILDIDRANLEILKFVRDVRSVAPPDDETPSGKISVEEEIARLAESLGMTPDDVREIGERQHAAGFVRT